VSPLRTVGVPQAARVDETKKMELYRPMERDKDIRNLDWTSGEGANIPEVAPAAKRPGMP
jgi:hypothetical protein